MRDIKGYTFTNGQKVEDWLDSLPAADREKAEVCIEEMLDQRRPLSFQQVKIRMSSTRISRPHPAQAASAESPKAKAVESEPVTDVQSPSSDGEPRPRLETKTTPDHYYSPMPEPEAEETSIGRPASKFKVNGWMYAVVSVVLLLLLAFITNPSQERHRKVMTEEIEKACYEIFEDYSDGVDPYDGATAVYSELMSDHIVNAVSSVIIDQGLEFKDYGLFSEYVLNYEGEQHTVSFGIFGFVYTFDKDQIKDVVDTIITPA